MARRERISDLKSMYHDSIKYEGYEFHEEHIPKEVVERVKTRIREKIIRKRRRSMIFSLAISISIFSIVIFLAVKYLKY